MILSKRNRIFIGILLAYALGVAALMYRLLGDIDPRYRESAEESLVETAYLLANQVAHASPDGALNTAALGPAFQNLYSQRFRAEIFGFVKTRVELRAVVVDHRARVIFDSQGRHLGEDYSQWRDVRLALAGDYGARTTPDIEGEANSSVMYVAAPVWVGNRIIGAVSVGKPVESFGQFVAAARRKTILVGATSVGAVLVFVLILSVWLARPFGLVSDYVRFVRQQRSFSLPRLSRRALGAIAAAYDEMRDALSGRNYVADYVQTLTHEVKSPLSAIRGAAELLQEPMPEADRQRFAANIQRETLRIQELVDRMLELTALETQRGLQRTEPVALKALLEEACASAQSAGAARRVQVLLDAPADATVDGDRLLLRRAVANLLDNALDFSPEGAAVRVTLQVRRRSVEILVQDEGPGIPDYAEDKVFEKFYSLPRPHSRKRSTGLGLPFVKEVIGLHDGKASLRNAAAGGALASINLPRSAPAAA